MNVTTNTGHHAMNVYKYEISSDDATNEILNFLSDIDDNKIQPVTIDNSEIKKFDYSTDEFFNEILSDTDFDLYLPIDPENETLYFVKR